MIKSQVNNFQYEIEKIEEKIVLNGKEVEANIISINENEVHILYNNQSYFLELVSFDKENKVYKIKHKGKLFEIKISDKYDALLNQLGFDKAQSKKINQLKAPMPGLVLNILAKEGEEYKKGDTLLILEAMKMENAIKSPDDVKIKSIHVNQKKAVDKNDLLITFE